MVANVFRRSRRQLTLFYSLIMACFLIVLIFAVHNSMKWAISSEQMRELTDMANNVARSQSILLQHHELLPEDSFEVDSGGDRLFFYAFDGEGRMLNYSRASVALEPFVLDTVWSGKVEGGEPIVFTKKSKNRAAKIMLTAAPIIVNGDTVGMVYVGKEVTAMFKGLQKATYIMAGVAVLALIIATAVGHILSGRAIIPLIEAYEKQRQFAADASHEMRTPLSVIMASADLLDNDPSIESPFLKQVIADVRDEVKKMSKLVGDLLLIARSDNEELELKKVRFSLAEAAERTLRLMQPLAEERNITLSLSAGDVAETEADEQKIKQLLLILVDNAVKYTLPGGRVEVEILAAGKGGTKFAVRDNGIGIAPEDQGKIFDRFFRADKARSREMGGNGLGLAIAREIVNLHGGEITVKSELGKGTVFTVSLK